MDKSLSDYQAGDLVANNPYFHQMSMSVLVAAMVDFVSPLRYCPINDRPFASDQPDPSIHEHAAAACFEHRI
jgi:hypothetical protein